MFRQLSVVSFSKSLSREPLSFPISEFEDGVSDEGGEFPVKYFLGFRHITIYIIYLA